MKNVSSFNISSGKSKTMWFGLSLFMTYALSSHILTICLYVYYIRTHTHYKLTIKQINLPQDKQSFQHFRFQIYYNNNTTQGLITRVQISHKLIKCFSNSVVIDTINTISGRSWMAVQSDQIVLYRKGYHTFQLYWLPTQLALSLYWGSQSSWSPDHRWFPSLSSSAWASPLLHP